MGEDIPELLKLGNSIYVEDLEEWRRTATSPLHLELLVKP